MNTSRLSILLVVILHMTVYKGDTNFIIGRIYLPNTTIKKSIIYLHAKKKIPIEQIEHISIVEHF